MNPSETPETLLLDARKLSIQQLNEALIALPASIASVDIVGCQSPDLLAPGLKHDCRVSIQGDLGDYCLCGISNTEIEIHGRAGCGLGEAMESGSIILHGDAGDATGAFNRGGLIAVYGTVGRRVAVGMCGGDLVVTGNVGTQAAMGMTGGAVLVFGSAGAMLGQNMTGGTIYIRGAVESMAPQLEESRLKETDRLRISLLFLKAGIQGEARDLRVMRVGNA